MHDGTAVSTVKLFFSSLMSTGPSSPGGLRRVLVGPARDMADEKIQ